MLHASLDESGIHANSDAVAVVAAGQRYGQVSLCAALPITMLFQYRMAEREMAMNFG
jgi:hypothetical protein